MKIILTAGGTNEKIDDVRSITNFSTGRLGYAIGRAFTDHHRDKVEKLYYLHGFRAAYIENDEKVEHIPIDGVMDLQAAFNKLLTEEKIDAVIQAMAVSDYLVNQVTTLDKLLGRENPQNELDFSASKIDSDIDDLIIHMKRAPKVISTVKELSPDTTLVGFKLLSGASHGELIDVGYNLLKKNGCDFVLANDLKEMKDGQHPGYLIHRDKSYDVMKNNEEIAEMIAKRVINLREGRGI